MESKKRNPVVVAAWLGIVLVVLAESAYLYCYFCYRQPMLKFIEHIFNQPLVTVGTVAAVMLLALIRLIGVIKSSG